MSFAQWVKDTREAKKLTIVECATRAGVSHPTWIEYENTSKQKQPKRETVLKVAVALKVKVAEGLEAAGYKTESAEIPARLVNTWRKVSSAPPDKQKAWLDSVDRSADLVAT